MDIEDNSDALRLRASLDLLLESLQVLLKVLARRIAGWASTACMAFTHLQPAEPTTVGYRLALFGQDLLTDLTELRRVRGALRGKGIKGAVGTSASFQQLLEGTGTSPAEFEHRVMGRLGLEAFAAASQTYPRKQDYLVAAALGSLAGSLYKFAFDVRLLQSPPIGEWSEGFAAGQIGSSAMPFKRNPINAEKIDSLGRLVVHLIGVTWDNAAHSLLERTLDDSANRRETLPTLFLALDEMLSTSTDLVESLQIDLDAVQRTLERYGMFAATERLMMELVRHGADRQQMHHALRDHSLKAWKAVAEGAPNPLTADLCADPAFTAYLGVERIRETMDASDYVGDAPERAKQVAAAIEAALE